MRVAIIGDVRKMRGKNLVKSLVQFSIEENISYLILAGGISNDFDKTFKVLKELGEELKPYGKQLRFITGNTDYYRRNGNDIKEDSFYRKNKKYESDMISDYFLENNPVVLSVGNKIIKLIGNSLWYDYSMYKGKTISAKRIACKRKMWYINRDVLYITSKEDYMLGLENTFDRKLMSKRLRNLALDVKSDKERFGDRVQHILITYFKPVDYFSDRGYIKGYKAAFEGSNKTFSKCKELGIKEVVFGMCSDKKYAEIDGIKIRSSGFCKNIKNSAVIYEFEV